MSRLVNDSQQKNSCVSYLPDSSKVAAICRNARKNVTGEERVTPLSCRDRLSGEGSLKHLAAMDLRAARTSGERTEKK